MIISFLCTDVPIQPINKTHEDLSSMTEGIKSKPSKPVRYTSCRLFFFAVLPVTLESGEHNLQPRGSGRHVTANSPI